METGEVTPRLLDQLHNEIRLRHHSIRSEHSYVQWVLPTVEASQHTGIPPAASNTPPHRDDSSRFRRFLHAIASSIAAILSIFTHR